MNQKARVRGLIPKFFGAAETITNRTAPVMSFCQCLKKIVGRTIFFKLTEKKE